MKRIVLVALLVTAVELVMSGCFGIPKAVPNTTTTAAQQSNQKLIEVVQQKYQVFERSSGGFDIAMCCEFKNVSNKMLKINEVDFTVYDPMKVSLGNHDMGVFGPDVLSPGETGYAMVTSGGSFITINSIDAVSSMTVEIDSKDTKVADRNLIVTPEGIVDYAYNTANKAVNCLVENQNSGEAYYYETVIGLHDAQGLLIGALSNSDTTPIKSGEKARIQAGQGWYDLIDWNSISTMEGKGRVTYFEDETIKIN